MKTGTKQTNEWSKAFSEILREKRLSVVGAWRLLVLQPEFRDLNRVTLYRWSVMPNAKVPDRARDALEILRQKPTVNASDETIEQWMNNLENMDERLCVMRTELKILIAQLSFHKK